ncbi:sulfonate transport system substrate-binding protein [Paraburkholderia fungorum]|uniref:Putative aliphatic sulfonates-binding protein n=1 Tax=Paraburkholderia fungorum TaxID=134537 RepID=A0A1H1JZK2_9BURK|nr:ABC transporter substrate-binding protein [Paraburkholderia fungorum]SDR55396.1 sulfonate transport system substrate-binding protein [Paraburkholderia fungorum]
MEGKRRRFLIQTAGAATGIATALLASRKTEAAPSDTIKPNSVLNVGVGSVLGPDVQMRVSGFERDLPYSLKWANFEASPPAMEALANGHLDIVLGGDTPLLSLATSPGRMVAVQARAQALFAALLVPAGSSIHSVTELKGKRVAVYHGAGFQGSLIRILREAGLRWSDIQPIYLAPGDAMAAFTTGKVDAWGIWDPNAAIAQTQFGASILSVPKPSGYGFQYANANSIADPNKRAMILDYLTRSQRAADWIRTHPAQWAQEVISSSHMPKNAALLSAGRTGGKYTPIDSTLVEDMQREANDFAELGVLPHRVDVRNAFDTRFDPALEKVFHG